MMKNKSMRVLYMIVIYILSAPIFAVLMSIGLVLTCGMAIRDDYTFEDVKDLIYAGLYGLKCGHATNMLWVKYGNDPNKIYST